MSDTLCLSFCCVILLSASPQIRGTELQGIMQHNLDGLNKLLGLFAGAFAKVQPAASNPGEGAPAQSEPNFDDLRLFKNPIAQAAICKGKRNCSAAATFQEKLNPLKKLFGIFSNKPDKQNVTGESSNWLSSLFQPSKSGDPDNTTQADTVGRHPGLPWYPVPVAVPTFPVPAGNAVPPWAGPAGNAFRPWAGECSNDTHCGEGGICYQTVGFGLLTGRFCGCERGMMWDPNKKECLEDPKWCNTDLECSKREMCCNVAACGRPTVMHCMPLYPGCPRRFC